MGIVELLHEGDVGVPDEVSLGEVIRRLDRFETDTHASFKALDDRFTNNVVPKEVYEIRNHDVLERIVKLEAEKVAAALSRRQMYGGVLLALLASAGSALVALIR